MVNNLPLGNLFTTEYRDIQQNRAIHDLDAQIGSTRARLNSEIRRIRGSLEQRLDRLSTSFDAFVELSDVRALLSAFAEPAAVRYRTHRILEGTEADGDWREDPPGYWLTPAARGLSAAVRGDAAQARLRVSEAAEIDALRAGTFALLGTAAAAPAQAPAMADWILPKLLPELSGEVTRYERALWTAAADGLLGEDARSTVRVLAEDAVRRGEEGDDPAARKEFWISAGPAPAPLPRSRVLADRIGVHDQLEAAGRLSGLRAWLEDAFAAPPENDDSAAGAEGPENGAGASGLDDESAETLRLLVDEGTAEEAPYLARAAQLRAVIESSGTSSDDTPAATWHDRAGTALDLLRADATSRSTTPQRRGLAVGAYAPAVLAAAEDLAEKAARHGSGETEVKREGQRVRISADGPDDASLRKAEASLEETYRPQGRDRLWAAVAVGAAAVLAVAGLATGSSAGFWAAGIALVAGSVFGFRSLQNTDRQEARERARKRIQEEVEAGVEECRDLRRQGTSAQEQAAADLRAVRRLFAA